MTFSIVARDGTAWGVAVASKFLAVGAAVPAARSGVGAIATQSYANLAYRPVGLAHLEAGATAQQALDGLTAADELREQRQAGIVDAGGRSATFTGSGCHAWAGGVAGEGYAIQGNILTGPEVVAAMEEAWRGSAVQAERGSAVQAEHDKSAQAPLSRRLLAALAAGDRAGGDRRGRQSAALLVVTEGGGYGGGSDVLVDLRVDDHAQPVTELERLLDLHDLFFTPADPERSLPLDGDLAAEVRNRLRALGHVDADLDQALADWAGIENLEERLTPGRIDPAVLEVLRATST
jgi:uncharacterized Ntn-hydrolase superfamily protein